MKKQVKPILLILDSLALLTFIATFTPLVLPKNTTGPFFLGVPYTMWVGFLISIIFVVLAYLVSLVNKEGTHAD